MRPLLRPLLLYGRTLRMYFNWAGTLLPLALFVFVPLGLVHAIPVSANGASLDALTSPHLAAAALVVLILGATGLIGEFFYSGVVAVALTRPHGDEPPSLRQIASTIKYGRLIAVDLTYAVLVAVGLVAFVLPGLLLYVYLGLAAPIVEIEHHGVRDALARSVRLVRGHFWLTLSLLLPLEVIGDAMARLATDLADSLLGESLLAAWLADTAANVVFTPFYAIAAVLLTLELIGDREGAAPELHSQPVRA